MESETLGQIKEWLEEQKIEKDTYKSHKAAIISSSDPFGLFATYKDEMGVVYEYTNGKIESVHYNGKSVDYT